jgi:uncharacterized protein YcbK (DUF882 family)
VKRLILLVLVIGNVASADELRKHTTLSQKIQNAANSAAARSKLDADLDKLIQDAKPPAPVTSLHNIWTGEILVVADKLQVDQKTLDGFLRDHLLNVVCDTHMDLRLIEVLEGAAAKFKTDRIDIVSGFRSAKFNLMLRKHMHEVARDSQHSHGHAVDFRIPGIDTYTLLRYVRGLHMGGAGYYPESEFVHADTGPIRTWEGH